MTQYNNNYQNPYAQNAYGQQAAPQQQGGELMDGMTVSAADLGDYDKGYVLLPEVI